ncbi:TetR/AcrR family transcriptional regulator [Membranihabitans marinus]|uniref:TetR/AcrR family transcriptional regulator n=1 Tax=Membranihabitans marinus TaxID=1227546 RepID=UPI001F443A98|nr:TetR/AcrR family transcriptional regulator [Membranihabitans marinus]
MDQKLKSELTKQNIVDKAFILFYENGYKSTSINDVMRASKMSKGAFYHHYQNKDQLGLEVIQSKVQKRVYEGMIQPLTKKGNSIDILKTTFIKRIKSFLDYEKQHGCPLNNLINEIGDFERSYQNALKNIVEHWKKTLVDLVEKGKMEDEIKKDVSSEAVAVYLISAFEGIRGMRKLYDNDIIIDQYIAGVSLFLDQLKK